MMCPACKSISSGAAHPRGNAALRARVPEDKRASPPNQPKEIPKHGNLFDRTRRSI